MKRCILLLCLLLVTGCTLRKKYSGDWEQKIDSPEMTYLMMNYAEAMKIKYEMTLEDSKVCYDDRIETVYARFQSPLIVDMCEARKIFVDMIEEFLDRLNHHALLGFELDHRFTADDLEFTIQFDSFFTEYVDPLEVAVICLRSGTVSYFAGNIKNFHADWSAQRIEPYFKSLEIVQAQYAAEQYYADELSAEPEMQPHPFIFGKKIPISKNGKNSDNGLIRKTKELLREQGHVEIPL